MATNANVTSLEALEAFRANLIVYLTRARRAVDEVTEEVHRTRIWVEQDRRLHWEKEGRRRKKILDQAEQELLSARMGQHEGILALRQAAVRKARAALQEAEDKLRAIKKISRDFEAATNPRLRALDGFRQALDFDIPKAIKALEETIRILASYSDLTPTPRESPNEPSSEPSEPSSSETS